MSISTMMKCLACAKAAEMENGKEAPIAETTEESGWFAITRYSLVGTVMGVDHLCSSECLTKYAQRKMAEKAVIRQHRRSPVELSETRC